MRIHFPLLVAVLLAASLVPALQAQSAPPTHELRASGEVIPLRRGYAPSAERVLAPDSIRYDDGSPGPDDYIGFGAPTAFYAATRFTTTSAFTLTGLRVSYNSASGSIYVWVFAADGQANQPASGTQLFTAQGNNPAPNGAFIPIGIQPTLQFPANTSFYIVVGFPDVIYPMGTDNTAGPGGAGRHQFSGTGENGSWTTLGDILGNGQPDAWVLRALGESGGGASAPDIAVAPGSLSLTAPAGGSTSGGLTIQNTGAGPLTWSASASSSLAPDVPRDRARLRHQLARPARRPPGRHADRARRCAGRAPRARAAAGHRPRHRRTRAAVALPSGRRARPRRLRRAGRSHRLGRGCRHRAPWRRRRGRGADVREHPVRRC